MPCWELFRAYKGRIIKGSSSFLWIGSENLWKRLRNLIIFNIVVKAIWNMNIHGELRNKRRKSPQKCIYLDTGWRSKKPTKSEETNKNHFKNCLFFQRSVNQKHQNGYQVQRCHWNLVRNMLEKINLLDLAFHRNQIHQLRN